MIINKETVLAELEHFSDFSTSDKSFSPCFSNIGIAVDSERDGSGALWLHYNRASRKMWNKFLSFPLKQNKEKSSSWCVVYGESDRQKVSVTFSDTDTVFASATGVAEIKIFAEADKKLRSFWIEGLNEKEIYARGFSENADDRDPDETVPFYVKVKAIDGIFLQEKSEIKITAENEKINFIFSFEFLETDTNTAERRIENSPKDFCSAAEKCKSVIGSCFEELNINVPNEKAASLAANALHGLVFNLAKAPGELKHHISSFPSRGAYPTHFLWDTCFQNLAYENMSKLLAKEFLLQFAQCQRVDGKYVQFICSTWGRPHYSQPALVGWATWRFYRQTGDKEFLETMLSSIEKNNSWWLSARASEYGLVFCDHGLETGQDDSPRFDNGATYACDMNAYVLNQLNITVKMCEELGRKEKAEKWKKEAGKLSASMLKYLYCEKDNIFFDLHPETKKPVEIISPVSFLPLWAGVEICEEKAKASIEKYLLNSELLFGDVPFPSVAYTDSHYEDDGWWRGPTWMPNAWLMLETLQKFGYEKEMRSAAERLLNVILKDEKMHELFNSKTGAGLGASQQGWTCAIFIKLCEILKK